MTFRFQLRSVISLLALAVGAMVMPTTVSAQTITATTNIFYWNTSSTNWLAGGSWYTNNSSPGVVQASYPGNGVTILNAVGVFNFSPSNGLNTVANDSYTGAGNIGGMIFNNSALTTIKDAGQINLNGFTATANNGVLYGIVLNPGAGTVTNAAGFNLAALFNQTWLNNSANNLVINSTVTSSNSPVTLTLGGSGNMYFNGVIANNSAAAPLTLQQTGPGNIYLAATNTYTGGTYIQGGAVVVTNTVYGLPNSGALSISAGGTLDLSALPVGFYGLCNSNYLIASGTGTNVGSTAATIKAAAGDVIGFYTTSPLTFNYDGADPALYLSQGSLSISNNTQFIINTTNGLPLTNGTYVIAQQASGSINSNGVSSYQVWGTAVTAGSTFSLIASNNVLLLTVTNVMTNAAAIALGSSLNGHALTGYYYNGQSSGAFSTANWFTSDPATNAATTFTSATNTVGIFNISSNNSVNETVNSSQYNFAGLIFNNSGATTVTNIIGTGGNYNGFSSTSGTNVYGVVVNPGAGPVTLVSPFPVFTGVTGGFTALALLNGVTQNWVNNSAAPLTFNGGMYSYYPGTATLALGGAGNIVMNALVYEAAPADILALVYNGTGTLTLSATNSAGVPGSYPGYSGGTSIQSGTVALTNTGTMGPGPVSISAGATLDASGSTINAFSNIFNTFVFSGAGTNVGVNAATIKGTVGGTIGFPATNALTFNYNGTNAALYISQGTLSISNNTQFIINTTNGLPLTNGTYVT